MVVNVKMCRNIDPVFCPECGYELSPIPRGRCSECGFGYDHAAIRDLAAQYTESWLKFHRRCVGFSAIAVAVMVSSALPDVMRKGIGFVCVVALLALSDASYYFGTLRWWLVSVLGCGGAAYCAVFAPQSLWIVGAGLLIFTVASRAATKRLPFVERSVSAPSTASMRRQRVVADGLLVGAVFVGVLAGLAM